MAATKESLKAKLPGRPTMPSTEQMKKTLYSKLPSRPNLPQLPSVREYLPDMPSVPAIPLPEPLERIKGKVSSVDSTISPLMQRLNYAILLFSSLSILGASEYLVFIPNNVVHLANESPTYPYVWTLLTSVFIEENLAMLGVFIALANYIVV